MKAIIAATILGIVMMFAGVMVKHKKSAATLAIVLILVLLGVNIWDLVNTPHTARQAYFNNMMRIDRYALWFNTLMTGCTLLYALLATKEVVGSKLMHAVLNPG